MAIEGVTSNLSTYQNTISKPVVTPTAKDIVIGNNPSTIAQEVLPVKGNENASNDETGNGNAQGNPPDEKVKKAVEEINKKLENTECVWGVDEKTERIVIRIVDKETKETVKELPPEKTLEMIAKVWELAGIMVDEKL